MDLQEQRVPPSRSSQPLASTRRWSWPAHQQGRWGYLLAWLIGVPVPILIIVYLLRGCT